MSQTHVIDGVTIRFNDEVEPAFIQRMYDRAAERQSKERQMIEDAKAEGAKVIGIDDGWHDRTPGAEKYTGVYPLYEDRTTTKVGDKLLLKDWRDTLRWYTLTAIDESRWSTPTRTYKISPIVEPSIWAKLKKKFAAEWWNRQTQRP